VSIRCGQHHWCPAKLVIVGAVLALLSVSCTNIGAAHEVIARSDNPVMLPDIPFRANANFTVYENCTDLHELRYNQNVGELV